MDIGLGLSQILAMAKKKPHPTKPDTGTAPEIDPAPEPQPDPVPVPDVAIPGVLDASRIVVLGSPIMEEAFGSPEIAPGIAAYAAEAGFTGQLRVHRDGGKDLAQSRQALKTLQAEMQDSEGRNLYLLHSGAEAVAAMRPYPLGAETLAAQYRDLLKEAASTGDKVIPVPLTKILYGRNQAKYPGNPHDVVDGNPATEAFGTLPYNQEIFYPAVRDQSPGWAPDHLNSDELKARLSLIVDRASVVAGEAVYLKIEGLSDEEAALWGFLWEFNTSGEFQYLSDLPWHMRQKNRATGHHQTAAWDTPGTKTVKVRVVPPVWSGKKGTVLSVRVENRDPDAEFFGKTAVLDASGVFKEAPAGERCTTWDEAYTFIKAKNSGRILLKRGDAYALTPDSCGDVSRTFAGGVMFDAWGNEDSPMPVIDVRVTGFNWRRPEAAPFHLIKNIRFQGGYDGITGNNSMSRTVIDTAATNPITIHGCEFSHVQEAVSVINPGLSNNMLAVYDCHITAWENYGIYTADLEKVLIRGSYICQDPTFPVGDEAKELGGPANQADHGPIRLSKAENMAVVVAQMRLFSCNGWSGGSPASDGSGVQTKAHQSVLRLGTLSSEGINALITEVYSEGGGYSLGGGNAGYTVGSGFVLFRGNYLLHTANWNGIGFGTTGCWCLDNIIVVPAAPAETNNNASWIVFKDIGNQQVTDTWASKPINIFNNTVAFMASHKDRVDTGATYHDIMTPKASYSQPKMPLVNLHDNVLWAPNMVLAGENEPRVPDGIYSAGTFGPKPLYRGWHYEDSTGNLHFDPQYATPDDSPILPLLSKDSALCGTADRSFTSALDFFGRFRGTEPTVGCVERNLCDALNPIVDPYELADRYPQLLGEVGSEGYGLSLGRYLLARVAAGALGIERGASRGGRSVLYNVAEGHPDEMAIGEVNRIRSLTDYTGFPLLCGAKFQDGGFDPYIEVNVEPEFDTGVTYDGAFSHARIADPRLHHDAVINRGLSLSGGKIHRLHFGGLTPGDLVTVSCVGITTSTGTRRGDLVLKAGNETLTEVLDAASDAASNMAVFAPVTVPGTGRISLSITPQKDASNAFLSAVLLDFA